MDDENDDKVVIKGMQREYRSQWDDKGKWCENNGKSDILTMFSNPLKVCTSVQHIIIINT